MKKGFLLCALAAVSLLACNDAQYNAKIQGTWLCLETSKGKLATDDAFVVGFNKGIETHAGGYTLPDNGSRWLESDSLTYTIKKDVLAVSGTNVIGDRLDLSFTIKSLTDEELIYQEIYFRINGVDYADNETYVLTRVTDTYSAQILGSWEGRSITPDAGVDYTFKITFKDDGTFDFYNKDDDRWVLAQNNNGSYCLYGNFLADNYTSPADGRDVYDCWTIEIENDVMTCTRLEATEGVDEFQISVNELRRVE